MKSLSIFLVLFVNLYFVKSDDTVLRKEKTDDHHGDQNTQLNNEQDRGEGLDSANESEDKISSEPPQNEIPHEFKNYFINQEFSEESD